MLNFEWDGNKAQINAEKHGVSFEAVREFDFDTAVVAEDDRVQYGETRMVALGLIGRRVHVLAYTKRHGTIRVISLRKANKRETRTYAQSL